MRSYRPVNLNPLWFLLGLNLVIFVVTLISGSYPIRIDNPVVVLLGLHTGDFLHQPWTIITNLFVHGSFGHIICNMVSLYFLGRFLIQLVGAERFLIVYFLGGIVGNILFILLEPHSIGIGASGAIFALGGVLAMIAPGLRVFIIPIPVPVPLWVAMAIFLLISFIGRGIAWQAHLGGLLLGLMAGYYFKKKRVYFY